VSLKESKSERMSDQTEDNSAPELLEEGGKLKEEQEKPMPGEGISDNELEVLPSNEEEEKEEILLTTTKSPKQANKKYKKNYYF
jgi:hypothetical protein